MSLKDLSELKFKADRVKYPSLPVHAVPRKVFTDKTANGLTSAILAYCELSGAFAQRSGSEGRYRQGATVVDAVGRTRVMKGSYLPGLNVGQGDLQIVLAGRIYSVEIKIGKDRQSEKQKDFESRLTSSGGIYAIVHSWEEFYNYWKTWTSKTQF